jgi:predicted DsbA family dithiol-disulfide isomerase
MAEARATPIEVKIFSDYQCPWCYVGALRLHKLEEEFAGQVKLVWKSYPLAVDDDKNRRFAHKSEVSWARAMEEEKGLSFRPHKAGDPAPTSSLPAQVAAKAALQQGYDAFKRYHMKLFEAHFERWLDISDRQVLIDLASEARLDADRLERDMRDPSWSELILAEKAEADRDYKDWGPGVPLAIFGERFPVLGAVPLEMYRHAVQRLLGQGPRLRWSVTIEQ